jgi:hypothetical protein
MISNADRTITVTSEEVWAAAELNEQLAALGVRVKALRADPDCSSTVAEAAWGDLYPRIVIQDDPRPGITIQPDAIPVDHVLVLAAERSPRPGRQPPVVVRMLLVRGLAPECIGEFFNPRSPVERFSNPAREVVAQARQEAFELEHLNVGPEHILLALLRRQRDVAAQALNTLDVTFEQTRVQVAKSISQAAGFARSSPLQAPFTPRATWAFDRARGEASALGDAVVEPAHILLGLVGDPECPVVRILRDNNVDAEQVRVVVTQLLNPAEPDDDAAV